MSDLIKRLWKKDTTLWSKKAKEQAAIAQCLGWLNQSSFMDKNQNRLTDFARALKKQHFTQIVLLGMGGSSLCPYLFSTIFGSAPDFPHMLVLDSTDPEYIQDIQAHTNPAQTLFIVASKSGSTIESNCLFQYFYTLVSQLKDNPGENFIAITDSGSSLVKSAQEHGFRDIFINPSDIGGRYSALSFFGLVPAAAIGMSISALKDSLAIIEAKCLSEKEIVNNPALDLAIYMAQMVDENKDKLTFLTDTHLTTFGLWLEQMVAESTGKKGTGIIPIVGELLGHVNEYGSDRCFVSIGLQDHEEKARLELTRQLKEQGFPVKEFTIGNPYDLAGEFLRWEAATALCGHLLDINPFDEPNVTESKKNTQQILSHFTTYGEMPQKINGSKNGWSWQYSPKLAKKLPKKQLNDLAAGLKCLFSNIDKNGYFGLLAYLPHQSETEETAKQIRAAVRHKLGCATVFGFGPRYLHSSGQEHKGGPDNGAFIIITRNENESLDIPGETFNFAQLQFAQALGDFQSLADKGRQVIHLNFETDYHEALVSLCGLIKQALS